MKKTEMPMHQKRKITQMQRKKERGLEKGEEYEGGGIMATKATMAMDQ